jgi:hypothetical protein
MSALGHAGNKAESGETPEIVALAVAFRALYRQLPRQNMQLNAAELHYSQPVISQCLNAKRMPSRKLLTTIYSRAAAEAKRNDDPGLPYTLTSLLEMRDAAKASLRKARTKQGSLPPLQAVHPETAGPR